MCCLFASYHFCKLLRLQNSLSPQAECEELQRRVESLSNENSNLREELNRLSAECEKLASANNSIKVCQNTLVFAE